MDKTVNELVNEGIVAGCSRESSQGCQASIRGQPTL